MTKPYLESSKYIGSEGNPDSKIWIIGEAPGADEVQTGKPFTGEAGELLTNALSAHGISRNDCFLTNLCHYRPLHNDFKYLLNTVEYDEGIAELNQLLSERSEKVILSLGNWPLRTLTSKTGITKFRGSCFILPNNNLLLPTFHPANVGREPLNYPPFDSDIRKLARYVTEGYKDPTDSFDFRFGESISWEVVERYASSETLAVDIESVKASTIIRCCGFARSEREAISINLNNPTGRSQVEYLLRSTAQKIFHFGSFDVTMLELNGFTVLNYAHDTIIQAHLLAPELPRKLAFLTSIYTDIPYYKSEGESDEDTKGWSGKRSIDELLDYNCKDCVATFICHIEQMKLLEKEPELMTLYAGEMKLVLITIQMGHNGLLRDPERHDILRRAIEIKHNLHEKAMRSIHGGVEFNPRSTKFIPWLLYEYMGLPTRKRYDKATKESKVTTDEDALISLINYCKTKMASVKEEGTAYNEWKVKLIFVQQLLAFRGTGKLLSSYIEVEDHLGRIKSLYKVAGTETGRLATGKFANGSGLNISTIPRASIEVPDEI